MLKKSLVLLLTLFLSLGLFAQEERTLEVRERLFSYFSNISLQENNGSIEKLIIVVHGSERNAITYFNTMNSLVKKTQNEGKIAVVAPHFKNAEDVLLERELNFDDEGWLKGDGALTATETSSFEIIDNFVNLAALSFPALKEVTIMGHSAGGQLTQRYALGSLLEKSLTHIKFRYIVTNPGSYAYPTNKRPVGSPENLFVIPENPACAYNDYKFGLENLNSYLAQSSVGEITERYAARKVIYLLGEGDNDPASPDQSCPAAMQGTTRLQRGLNFKAMMDSEFPGNAHEIYTVPGVGHTQWGMYTSAIGTKLIFSLP